MNFTDEKAMQQVIFDMPKATKQALRLRYIALMAKEVPELECVSFWRFLVLHQALSSGISPSKIAAQTGLVESEVEYLFEQMLEAMVNGR